MIRYSTSRSTIRLANQNTLTELVSAVEKEYRELLDLREQVKKAEADAKRFEPRGKLKVCAGPVAKGSVVAEANRTAVSGIHQAPALRHIG